MMEGWWISAGWWGGGWSRCCSAAAAAAALLLLLRPWCWRAVALLALLLPCCCRALALQLRWRWRCAAATVLRCGLNWQAVSYSSSPCAGNEHEPCNAAALEGGKACQSAGGVADPPLTMRPRSYPSTLHVDPSAFAAPVYQHLSCRCDAAWLLYCWSPTEGKCSGRTLLQR